VRIGDLTEIRDLPFDTGEVLEIRRRREEEHIDAFAVHALGETAPPLGVVEHSAEFKTRENVPAAVRLPAAARSP
jgi:hypothetical protein